MTKKYPVLFSIFAILFTLSFYAQERNPWSRIDVSKIENSQIQRRIRLNQYSGFALDRAAIDRDLENLPSRRERGRASGRLMKFPDKKGRLIPFRIIEAPVMSKELSEKYPNNRSYSGIAADGSNRKIRFSLNEIGLYAVITGPGHEVEFIEPLTKDKLNYRVYDRNELGLGDPFECFVDEALMQRKGASVQKAVDDLKLRTYRLAVATTGEYSQFHIDLEGAGTGTAAQQKAVVLAAITTAITRVNAVFENDLAVTLELIDGNDEIIYLDPGTDPYSNNNGSAMLGENQSNLDAVIGTANYDIGHVLSTGGGGVATLGGACVANAKARGVTGSGNPVGDNFYFDFVAHEFGHQLGANHTFNGDDGNCEGDNRNDDTAVEPGSGSSLMGYAGLCASQNVQSHSDLYFHQISIEEIVTNIHQGAGGCAQLTDLINNKSVPLANAGPDFVIPVGTPFVLKGSGSDGDNDPISFCWEQIDNEITAVPPSGTSVGGALYRSLPPTEERERYLPQLRTLVQGTLSSTWEVTPLVAREMNFALTVRDNNPEAGQLSSDVLKVTVTDAAGPFTVSSQGTDGIVWTPNSQESISWNVAGTTGNGVGVNRVNIRLSTDGGKSFPVFLASNVPNDGSQNVTVPDTEAPKCFIMVEAVGNFFFALNAKAFSIGEFNEVCTETVATDTPINIPDNDPTGITSEIEVSEDVIVELVRVRINDLQHSYLGDLNISLESPSGTVIELLSGACDGSENIENAIFDDAGAEIDCAFPPTAGISGEVKPLQELNEFFGENALGKWKLKVVDRADVDFGSLEDWSLEICSSEPVLGVNNYVFDGFKLFPNPSNGRFRVQFNSEETGDVEIKIYDLLGRQVAQRTYLNPSVSFDQEVNLNGLSSGLYILRVRRGNKISSQKINLE